MRFWRKKCDHEKIRIRIQHNESGREILGATCEELYLILKLGYATRPNEWIEVLPQNDAPYSVQMRVEKTGNG